MNNDGAVLLSSASGKAAEAAQRFGGRQIRNYVGGGSYRWRYHPALRRGRFNRWDAYGMLQDEAVGMGLLALRSPFPSVNWEVRANSREIKTFIENTIHRFWQHDLAKVLLHYLSHGTCVAEVLYDRDPDTNLWKYVGLDDFNLDEVQALRRGRVLTGARISYGGAGMIGLPYNPVDSDRLPNELRPPKLFWLAHESLCADLFGRSIFERAFPSWMEKVGAHGAIDIRKLWCFTAAFRGAIIVYPPGGTTVNGIEVDNQDIAREIGEKYSTGATMTMPYEPDEKTGKNMWEIRDPVMNGDIKGLVEYPGDLNKEIWRGMDIPPECIESSDAQGWGNAKGVPMLMFLNGTDLKAREVMTAFDVGPGGYTSRSEQSGGVIRPLVQENFGPKARYEIRVFPLVPKQAPPGAGGPGGAPGAPPQPGQGAPGQDAPPPIPGAGSAPMPGIKQGGAGSASPIGLSQAVPGEVELSNELVCKILGRELPAALSQAHDVSGEKRDKTGKWTTDEGRSSLLAKVREKTITGRSKYGDCEVVADEFLSAARTMGLADESNSYIAWGYRQDGRKGREAEGQHQWAVIDGKIYDGTSDQFSAQALTIADVVDARYRETSQLGHTFRKRNTDYGVALSQARETTAHEGKRPGEFAPQGKGSVNLKGITATGEKAPHEPLRAPAAAEDDAAGAGMSPEARAQIPPPPSKPSLGARAAHAPHAASAWIVTQVNKLPAPLRVPVKGVFQAAYGTYILAGKAIEKQNADMPQEKREAVASCCAALDCVLGMKVIPYLVGPAVGMLTGDATAGTLAGIGSSFVPAASLAYLAFSHAPSPMAVLRAVSGPVAAALARRKAATAAPAPKAPETPVAHAPEQPTALSQAVQPQAVQPQAVPPKPRITRERYVRDDHGLVVERITEESP